MDTPATMTEAEFVEKVLGPVSEGVAAHLAAQRLRTDLAETSLELLTELALQVGAGQSKPVASKEFHFPAGVSLRLTLEVL